MAGTKIPGPCPIKQWHKKEKVEEKRRSGRYTIRFIDLVKDNIKLCVVEIMKTVGDHLLLNGAIPHEVRRFGNEQL